MNTSSARVGARFTIAAALLCGAAPVIAADFDYRLSLGAGFSDNLGRVSENEQDESIATAGARFSFDQNSAKLQADVVGDVSYYKYLDDTFDPELIGNVYANTAFTLLPERFIWSLTDQFGQVAPDPFQPATPDNRENINYFATGPDFIMGLGSQMRLRLGARYSLVDYEDDPLDSTSTGGQLALVRELSDRSSISLNGSVRDVEYDEVALNADFDQTEAYLRYEGTGARTNLEIEAGYSQLDRDALEDSESGALVRVNASRRMSSSSTLILNGGREFSTAAGAFAINQGAGIGAAPGRQTADPFTLDRALLGWTFNRNVTGVTVSTSWSKRSYDGSPELDESSTTLSARFRRDLSPSKSLEIATSYSSIDYQQPSVDSDDLTVGVLFMWRLSRALTLEARYDFSNRSSDTPSSEYTENRLFLTIGYGRGEPRATRVAPTFGVDSPTPAGN
jgi:hypothetical protein